MSTRPHQRPPGPPPSLVAAQVVDAVRQQRFYVLPNPDEAAAAVSARLRWMTDNLPPPPRAGRPGL